MTDEELQAQQDEEAAALNNDAEAQPPIQDAPPYGFRVPIADAPAAGFIEPPQPVWAGSSAADINAANATAPMRRSYAVAGMPATSFIPGVDTEESDLRQMKVQEAAMRFKGQQLYSSLVQGGATPAEAYRASAHLLNFSHPENALKVDALIQRKQPTPLETVTRDGITYYRGGNGNWVMARTPAVKPPPMVKGTVPADVKQQDEMLKSDIATKRTTLARGFKYGVDEDGKAKRVPYTPEEEKAIQDSIASLESKRKALIAPRGFLKEEYNPAIDQAEFARIKDRWENPEKYQQAPMPSAAAPTVVPPVVTTRTPEGGIKIGRQSESSAPSKANEVRRMVGNRIAVYDADSKKFLRFE